MASKDVFNVLPTQFVVDVTKSTPWEFFNEFQLRHPCKNGAIGFKLEGLEEFKIGRRQSEVFEMN